MNLFSYVLRYDGGFAPNPFHGSLTLACCKPQIRKTARIGDWIMGTSPAPDSGRLVFLAKVSRSLTFDYYWELYPAKRPCEPDPRGDNIYRRLRTGKFEQLPNPSHDHRHQAKDLSVNRVLICDDFFYFGRQSPRLPDDFQNLVHSTQGHSRFKDEAKIQAFIDWVHESFQPGILGEPTLDEVICLPDEEEED